MTDARERMVRVVAETLFEEERNASMGFDHWPESFNAMDALGQGAYLDLAEAVVAALGRMTTPTVTERCGGGAMSEPLFGSPVGPWFRWFAWRPVRTADRGWRWMRFVWRRRYQSKLSLPGPIYQWFHAVVEKPTSATEGEPR